MSEKRKFNFYLSEDAIAKLEKLVEELDATQSHVLRLAINLTDKVFTASKKGEQVIIRDKKGNEKVIELLIG